MRERNNYINLQRSGKMVGISTRMVTILCVILLSFCFGNLQAQVISNRGGLSVSSGTVVSNVSDVNNTSGTISNNGTITITGNYTNAATTNGDGTFNIGGSWTNNGTFNPGTSTVIFNGSSAQTIGGSTSSSFNNLDIANTSGGVSLTRPTIVGGNLILSSGILTTDATNILYVTNSLPAAISAGSTTKFVNGPLKWLLATGAYVFPIGKSTSNYFPFTLSPSAASSPVVTIEAFDVDAASTETHDATLESISHTEYWNATLNSGTLTGNVSLTRQTGLATEDVVATSSAQGGSYTSIGGSATGSSINNSNSVSSLGYFVMATAKKDCPTSTAVTLAADQTVCQGVPATQLSASVTTSGGTGIPGLHYQWYYNTSNSNTLTGATLIAGAISQAFTPLSGTPEAGTTRYYFCVGYAPDNGCGQTNATQALASNTVTVVVNALPAVFAGSDASIPNGTSTTLSAATVTGTGSFTYSWTPAEQLVDATVLNPTTLNLASTTTFTLTATSTTSSCSNSDQVTIAISGGPLSSVSTASPATVCAGDNVQLDASAGGGSGSYSYSWTSVPTGFTSSTANPIVNPTVSTTYHVAVNDGFSTVNSQVSVTVNDLPIVAISNDNGLALSCSIPNTTLTASGGGTYSWSTGASTAAITVSSASTYTVIVTGANGCTATASATTTLNNTVPTASISSNNGLALSCTIPNTTLTASGGVSYLWNTGAITPTINVSTAGPFTVTVTGANGCTATASVTTSLDNTPPTASISNDNGLDLSCSIPSTTLTASGGGNYLWSTGATSSTITVTTAGTFSVTVTAANGCTSTASVITTLNNTPPTAAIVNNTGTTILTCATTAISVTATGGGTYSWSDGASVVGTNANLSITSTGTYTVTVTTANGCSSTASISITQNIAPPLASISVVGSTTFCQGESVTLTSSCLLYTSPSPRDRTRSRMPSSA